MAVPDDPGPNSRRYGIYRARRFLRDQEQTVVVELLVHSPRIPRRPSSHVPNLFRRRSARIFLLAEGREPRCVSRQPRAGRTHVPTWRTGDQRQPDRGGEMNRENRAFECDAITAAWNAKKLWALQVLGSIALLLGTYGWLRIPDAKVLQVGFTAVLAIILVMAFLWLEAGTLAYFRQPDS